MDEIIERYLVELSNELKYVKIDEKKEILDEIESHFYEKIENGSTPEVVVKGLGTPKELARAYDGKSLHDSSNFNIKGLLNMIKHYGLWGAQGTIVLSFVGSLSIAFYLGSFLIVIGVIIKVIGSLLGYDLPLITLDVGFGQASIVVSVIVSLIIAFLMYISSLKMWKYLKGYILKMTKR